MKSLPYKWELVVLLWFAYFFNQGDRQIFNVVLPLIKADLGLSDVQLGLVASIFTWFFALLVPFSGYAGDAFRRKWIVFGSLLTWSVATLVTGFSAGLLHLILFRSITTGGGEAFYYPSANSLIGDYHEKTRAMAMSIHQTSLYAGIVVSGFAAGFIGERLGWRAAFFIFGGLGILLAFIVLFRLRDTEAGGAGRSAQERISPSAILRQIFRKPTVALLSLAFAGVVFVNIGYLTWMPTFLHEKFQMSLAQAGFASMFYHHLFAFAGVLLGGKCSDRWSIRRPQARVEIECLGLLLGAPFIYVMGSSNSLLWTCAGLAGFGFFRGVYDSNIYAALFDVIEPRVRASVSGVMICFAFMTGAFAPILLGWAKQTMGLDQGIAALSAVYLASAGFVFAVLKMTFDKDFVCLAAREV
ncbi:MAG: MFS transporter [Acidobacteria bacterium]|nr:MFS transporter [Acidobacteriota bacterium]MCI0718045.1 MFS transporter [Acidobacteriota bacterium]